LAIVGAFALIVYAWVVAGLRPFTDPENILVALPILAVLVLTPVGGRRSRMDEPIGARSAGRSCGWAWPVRSWRGLIALSRHLATTTRP
jgi:hypothetical protein